MDNVFTTDGVYSFLYGIHPYRVFVYDGKITHINTGETPRVAARAFWDTSLSDGEKSALSSADFSQDDDGGFYRASRLVSESKGVRIKEYYVNALISNLAEILRMGETHEFEPHVPNNLRDTYSHIPVDIALNIARKENDDIDAIPVFIDEPLKVVAPKEDMSDEEFFVYSLAERELTLSSAHSMSWGMLWSEILRTVDEALKDGSIDYVRDIEPEEAPEESVEEVDFSELNDFTPQHALEEPVEEEIVIEEEPVEEVSIAIEPEEEPIDEKIAEEESVEEEDFDGLSSLDAALSELPPAEPSVSESSHRAMKNLKELTPAVFAYMNTPMPEELTKNLEEIVGMCESINDMGEKIRELSDNHANETAKALTESLDEDRGMTADEGARVMDSFSQLEEVERERYYVINIYEDLLSQSRAMLPDNNSFEELRMLIDNETERVGRLKLSNEAYFSDEEREENIGENDKAIENYDISRFDKDVEAERNDYELTLEAAEPESLPEIHSEIRVEAHTFNKLVEEKGFNPLD